MRKGSVIIVSGCLFLLFSVILNVSCSTQTVTSKADPAYILEIDQWHEKRIESLKSDTGWLTLAGLFWLEDGDNSFGSDPSNAVVFPGENVPASIGIFELSGGDVIMKVNDEVNVMSNNEPVNSINMVNDIEGTATVAELGSLNWHVIKRENRYGIRLKDKNNPNLLSFKGIDRFPVNPAFRVQAFFKPYSPVKTITIPNVIGQETEEQCPGYLEFSMNGKTFTLDVMGASENNLFFVIFSDNTNGELSYGAGRFLSVERPDEHGITNIDFNKSYSPPCAFTKFATCPLPPTQNYMDIQILAGEKKPDHLAH